MSEFYWVQFHKGERWQIAELNSFGWKLFGSTITCPTEWVEVVGPQIMPPSEESK